ncbi:uncharacterized protein LOC131680257 [Topomyia yanbarensis]|uniref:uncharacterized protein LOC131680257 n=1 Tax=Topomyia yanbarensis TaxID=2498891 RepID=UPI00273C09C2|nr:uncharacterized protein LOC131680257 [Topomyia yanbarensis]
MANNAGPCSSKRHLLARISSSILRYGGPVWIAALQTQRNRVKLSSTFRLMAMRVASTYKTISSVIAEMIPIGIILVEDNECYKRKGIRGIRKTMRVDSMAKKQHDWDSSEKGRLTHRVIPVLSTWVNRRHGKVTFYLTQFLSGHGCFKQYLHRFEHTVSPFCSKCINAEEIPEHVIVVCPRFDAARWEIPSLNVESVETRTRGMPSAVQ